jgi:NAD(P)-dependent dehydrogenase (short-subunit alcohol dehydrogenase family)
VGRAGGIPVLLDIVPEALACVARQLSSESISHLAIEVDLNSEEAIRNAADQVQNRFGGVWGLVNNVASNPPMGPTAQGKDRLENFPIDQWEYDIRLGLTSAFLCSRYFGGSMAQAGRGSIVNIASDLAIISPDQRMYAVGLPEASIAPVKPVSYSVVKSALLGLTRYLSTYWSPLPVRCNALLPGSVGGTQSPELILELTSRIPLGRLAEPDEYQGALVFLLSDASSYMTGATLVMDGGRNAW